jgi:hypothetical protein
MAVGGRNPYKKAELYAHLKIIISVLDYSSFLVAPLPKYQKGLDPR